MLFRYIPIELVRNKNKADEKTIRLSKVVNVDLVRIGLKRIKRNIATYNCNIVSTTIKYLGA